MPKTRIRPTYVAGGIFAFLFGMIVLALFIPNFCSNILFIPRPWDWASVLGIGTEQNFSEFLMGIGGYINLILPVILIIITIASFFIGHTKSSLLVKSSFIAFLLAMLVKYAPLGLNDMALYFQIALTVAGMILLGLGFVFFYIRKEKELAYHANSFHFFCAIFMFLFTIFDIVHQYLFPILSDASNYVDFVPSTVYGLFGIIAGVWLICIAKRDTLEFGMLPPDRNEKKAQKALEKQRKLEEKEQKAEEKTPEPAPAPESQAEPKPEPKKAPDQGFQVGPDGVEYRIITQRLPNGKVVQLRIDRNGKPLPPLKK